MEKQEILTLKQVTKRFGSGHTEVEALKEIDFSVKQGEFAAVVGPSGSGKSTFLTIAGGLQTPSEGRVKIAGQNIDQLKEKERASLRFDKIGFILQASNLVPFLTVSEQFSLIDRVDSKKKDPKRLTDLLKTFDIMRLEQSYPRDLSGGERQRVAIALALYHQPAVILADEPTASLDSDRAFEVVRLLAKEAHLKNTATVMVTHDQRLLTECDKVYEMSDGNLRMIS